jgi:hypothetical protein
MTKNKDRIYIMLHARGGPGYHWALTRSPKREDPTSTNETARYHARNFPLPGGGRGQWEYDRGSMGAIPTNNALVRILIGKLKPSMRDQMEDVLAKVVVIQGNPQWNCRTWLRTAIEELVNAGIVHRKWDWEELESKALWYVQMKEKEGRFRAVDAGGTFDGTGIPTYDLLRNCETRK